MENFENILSTSLGIQPLGDIIRKDYPEEEWLVQDLVPGDASVILSANQASLKTWFCLELARCVASGQKFLDKFKTVQTNVLIMDAESLERRINKRSKILSIDPTLPIYYKECHKWRLTNDNVSELATDCAMNNIKLVIFDSLVRFHNANENDAREMSKVFEQFDYLKSRGITSLIICHNRKGGSNEQANRYATRKSVAASVRGSSDIAAACDHLLVIERPDDGNIIQIINPKSRDDEEIHTFNAKFTKVSATKSVWTFEGLVESKEEERERLKSVIYGQILASEYINQKDLRQLLENNGYHIAEKRFSMLMSSLVNEGYVSCKNGNRHSNIYYINGDEGKTQNV